MTTYPAARFDAGCAADLARMPSGSYSPSGPAEHNNTVRSSWAGHTLAHYASMCGDNTDEVETVLSDLLADLRHLADAVGVDFADADDSAERRYREELSGEL